MFYPLVRYTGSTILAMTKWLPKSWLSSELAAQWDGVNFQAIEADIEQYSDKGRRAAVEQGMSATGRGPLDDERQKQYELQAKTMRKKKKKKAPLHWNDL